jgi:hypothetical protein
VLERRVPKLQEHLIEHRLDVLPNLDEGLWSSRAVMPGVAYFAYLDSLHLATKLLQHLESHLPVQVS